ncbi:protein of unknown function (plasmid) [Cupriavidus taiwanensis]|uniref:Uncharacterized protein n=1 Tax=Cupriavidus taiwanensis TaxID=164546 RepID=A0A375HEK6_9BURK|nr:protein of unknown function [Cupriavidus taiwanensis]SOZ72001.1 protein of unknown function [Cupriavidus taiwanensis]SOZ74353.1 protein of unknown function [Cupriavidus taiwanensis]SPA03259.1 protein of unknown function [Cupriavidus taiwanensis]SPA57202.1 protein of unknown function [Cupriavidus taiwanensis]
MNPLDCFSRVFISVASGTLETAYAFMANFIATYNALFAKVPAPN